MTVEVAGDTGEWHEPLAYEPLLSQFRDKYGYGPQALEQIGALILGCALFENQLELMSWYLDGVPQKGARPKTDELSATAKVDHFALIAETVCPEAMSSIGEFKTAAKRILIFRNAIAHGYPLPTALGGTTIANRRWVGEVRKRARNRATIASSTLELALAALDRLSTALNLLTIYDPPGCVTLTFDSGLMKNAARLALKLEQANQPQ